MAGLLVVTAAGCATVRGFGEDISSVGHWIISSAVHAIGCVIAIPFIIVGGLIRVIFGG